jgi:hypothetical protein
VFGNESISFCASLFGLPSKQWSKSMQTIPSPFKTKPKPWPSFDLDAVWKSVQVKGLVELAEFPWKVIGTLFLCLIQRGKALSSAGI